jgi:hypothetical protein
MFSYWHMLSVALLCVNMWFARRVDRVNGVHGLLGKFDWWWYVVDRGGNAVVLRNSYWCRELVL